MSQAASSEPAQANHLSWYYLRRRPAAVLSIVGLILLVLNFVPRTMDHMGEVYPGAGAKPVVRDFGFPQSAIYFVSTVQTNEGHHAFGFGTNRPSKVTIEFVHPGPKLQWLASTQILTFDDGSTTYVSSHDLLLDIAVMIVLIVVTLALCKWWTNKLFPRRVGQRVS